MNDLLLLMDSVSKGTIRGAVQLTAALDAHLIGLFIEDVNIIKVAEIPVVTELRIYTSTAHPLDSNRVQRQLRAQSRRAGRLFKAEAHHRQINWTFDIRRGEVQAEIAAVAPHADLVILGTGPGKRLSTTTQHVIYQTNTSLLLLDRPLPHHPNIITMYDGSELAQKALENATRITKALDGFLTVLTVAENTIEGTQTCQSLAFSWLANHDMQAGCRWLMESQPTSVVNALYDIGADLFITPESLVSFSRHALMETINQVRMATLVVR